jgi:hypothetical protein
VKGEATLHTVNAILDASQDGYDDTRPGQPDPIGVWHTPLEPSRCHARRLGRVARVRA